MTYRIKFANFNNNRQPLICKTLKCAGRGWGWVKGTRRRQPRRNIPSVIPACPPLEGEGRNLWIPAGVYPVLDTGMG